MTVYTPRRNESTVFASTSMSVLYIVRPKCTLAASHTTAGESRWACRRERPTDRQTSDSYITFSARRGQCDNLV